MTRIWAAGLLVAGWLPSLAAQTRGAPAKAAPTDDPVMVSTEHPRLFLRPQRLRLLKRERERTSARWQQFELFMVGKAPMPERGLAEALYYQVSGNADAGRRAVAWALGPGLTPINDLRQQALVFDWCQDVLSAAQRRDLAARLQRGIADTAANESMTAVRSRVLAAVALFDHVPLVPQRELERVVRNWWGGKIVPALQSGRGAIGRDDAYPLWELLHAVRDSTNLDLREAVPRFFKDFPIEHLMSYYPALYPAPENEYRIGFMRQSGEPDLQLAALSRAAEMAMVALDVNAPESQVLQGWLMHDNFMLKGTFGAPYEFLWANPYQPGLSYYLVPLVYHNAEFGHLFVRSSWEDTADWLGYYEGVLQMFSEGKLTPLNPQKMAAPVSLKEAMICFGQQARKFRMTLDEEQAVFIMGLGPKRAYEVEIDDEEMFESAADPGGILELDLPRGKEVGVRIREFKTDAGGRMPGAR
jgi:hypothetical protein